MREEKKEQAKRHRGRRHKERGLTGFGIGDWD